jgi:hypothetical protein
MFARLLGIILCFSAIAVPAQDTPATPKTGSVTGTVADGKSDEPIAKAVVILRRDVQGMGSGIGTVSGADGKFKLRDLDPGTYAIDASRDGHVVSNQTKQTVEVQAGEEATGVKLKLVRAGAVSGRVLDPDGEPVSGVAVMFTAVSAKKGATQSQFGGSTNDLGEYRAFHIAPGDYHVSVLYTPSRQFEEVHMQRPEGVAGATASDAYPVVYYPGTTDERQAVTVSIEPGADIHGVNLQLVRARGVRVRGRVVPGPGAGQAPLFQLVELFPIGSRNRIGPSSTVLIRGAKGEFEFNGVLPGSYRLELRAASLNGRDQTAARIQFDVGASDIEGIQLMPLPPQTVSGRIIPPEGRKLPSGLIVLLASREPGETQGAGATQPGPDGKFTMPQIQAGDYDVLVASTTGADDDSYIASIRMGDVDALAEGMHVGDAAPAPVEIVLKPNGAALDCKVTGADGKQVPGATVLLTPDPPKERQMALFGESRSKPDGTCRITGITPGDYHVYALPEGVNIDRRDSDALKAFEKYAVAMRFEEGDRKSTELKFAAQ